MKVSVLVLMRTVIDCIVTLIDYSVRLLLKLNSFSLVKYPAKTNEYGTVRILFFFTKNVEMDYAVPHSCLMLKLNSSLCVLIKQPEKH